MSGGRLGSRSQEECEISILWDILSRVSFSMSANSNAIVSIFSVSDLISSSLADITSSFSTAVFSISSRTASMSALDCATCSCKSSILSLNEFCISRYCRCISAVFSSARSDSWLKPLSSSSIVFLCVSSSRMHWAMASSFTISLYCSTSSRFCSILFSASKSFSPSPPPAFFSAFFGPMILVLESPALLGSSSFSLGLLFTLASAKYHYFEEKYCCKAAVEIVPFPVLRGQLP
mmetsp:Transcript_6087/g.15044  ORF Transcript_6087/g.15044 Transcript_6087/m.15044 type:complete len:234 (+) Transcript_6087:221-922(+)